MPCHPHPLEVRETSLTERYNIVLKKAYAIQNTLKLFEDITTLIDLAQLKADNIKRYKQLQKEILLQENLVKAYPIPKALDLTEAKKHKDGQKIMIEIDKTMDIFENTLSEKYSKYEIALCAFRDLLLSLEPYLTVVELPKNIKFALKEERKLHLQHRKEDQAAKIKQLRNQMKNMQGNNSERTIDPEIEAIKDQIARIESFSNEELLSDRNLF